MDVLALDGQAGHFMLALLPALIVLSLVRRIARYAAGIMMGFSLGYISASGATLKESMFALARSLGLG